MDPEQLEILRQSIDNQLKAGIETHVNGKIGTLTQKLDDYIISDNEWKEKAQPIIDLGYNIKGTSKAILYLAGIVSAIGGAWLIITNIFKK